MPFFAYVDGAEHVRAEKGLVGYCLPSPPGCGGKLYPRVEFGSGTVRPHWAHYPDPDGLHPCDGRASEMSEWHSFWQSTRIDDDSVEVVVSEGGDARRADIVTPAGVVVEAQHSAIGDAAIEGRESFWSRHRTGLAWLIDATELDGAGVVNLAGSRRQATNWVNYRLPQNSSYARLVRRVRAPKVTVWVDFGESGIVEVHSHGDARGSGPIGRGWLVTRDWFVEHVINGEFVTHHDRPSPARANRPARARRTDQVCRRLLAVAERGTGRAEREVANLAPEDLEQVATALPWNTDVATLAQREVERRRRQEELAAEQERRRAELEQRLAEQERQRAEAEAQARARAEEERERWERERPEREARQRADRERWEREHREREAARAERERLALEEWERQRQERLRAQQETWDRIQARRAPQPCVYGCTPALLYPCGWRCAEHAPGHRLSPPAALTLSVVEPTSVDAESPMTGTVPAHLSTREAA